MFRRYLLFALALCGPAFAVYGKQNPVRQAEKLLVDYSKIEEARKLMKTALADSVESLKAKTHFTAGRVEREVYRHSYKLLSINRKDPSVDLVAMSDALLEARRHFLNALKLDTVADKKGVRRTTYSPEIATWITSSAPAFYNAGIAYMNKRLFYPQAYTAFVTYAELPDQPYFIRTATPQLSDSLRANAFYYGGVMAYNAKQWDAAAAAFRKARGLGYHKKEIYLNEISSMTQMAKADTSRRDSLTLLITALSGEALTRHGVDATPVFVQKYVAGLLVGHRQSEAIAALDTLLSRFPHSKRLPLLHSLKASVLASQSEEEAAIAEYRLAADSLTDDFDILKGASAYLAEVGVRRLQAVSGRTRQARQRSAAIRADLLTPALNYARLAVALKPDDPDLPNIIDTLTYNLH